MQSAAAAAGEDTVTWSNSSVWSVLWQRGAISSNDESCPLRTTS